jgi:hypothetical protein
VPGSPGGGHAHVQVLDRRLRRIAEELRAGVADEVDALAVRGLPHTTETGWARLTASFPSGDTLLDELQVSPSRDTWHACIFS